MTDVTPTITRLVSQNGFDGLQIAWANIGYDAANIGGVAYGNVRAADRSMQVTGTFGSGGHVKLYGSNDGTNYAVLNDPQGSALDFTAAGIKAVLELTKHIKPVVTGGDGTTALTVTMILGGRK